MDDITALKKIIIAQRAQGARISTKLDGDQYVWNEEGRLVQIYWSDGSLRGSISFSSFTALEVLDCSGNDLGSLDVSGNVALKNLDCSRNELSDLDVSRNVLLERLVCSGNLLSSLNVSQNVLLKGLVYYIIDI